MNQESQNELRETAWRRDLSQAEQSQLAGQNPDAAEDWQLDRALGRAIRSLPPTPVASNFTSRVLDAVERETRAQPKPARWRTWLPQWRGWMPRLAGAALVCLFALVGWRQHQSAERSRTAQSVRQVAALANAPLAGAPTSLDVWENFDTIRRLGTTGGDEELLGVLTLKQ